MFYAENLDTPLPDSEWKSTLDTWIRQVQLGEKILILPPDIIVIGPSRLATVNTIARSAAVSATPVVCDRYSAIGDANTLHA